MNTFEIVKKAIDEWDCCSLLAGDAPDNEYDSESRRIADKINAGSDDIACVISEVFTRSFGKPFSYERCIDVADKIKKAVLRAETEKVISAINAFLNKYDWMFFEIRSLNPSLLWISGTLDETTPNYLCNIFFENPHSLIMPLIWETESKSNFIEIDEDDGLIKMNEQFNTEIGNYIFKMQQVNIRNDDSYVYAAAKNIRFEVL